MRKGIFTIVQESLPALSAEQALIARLKRENRQLKQSATRQQRTLATEGLFDFFKPKSPIAPVHKPEPIEDKTAAQSLQEEYLLLRDVGGFKDAGVKMLEGNKRIYCSFFTSVKELKQHFLDMGHLVDFIEKVCQNTVKAYDAMHSGAVDYAKTGNATALFQAHKAALKHSEIHPIPGFKKEEDEVETKDFFQSILFTPTRFISRDATWVIGGVSITHKNVAEDQLEKVAEYDFPMISYASAMSQYAPASARAPGFENKMNVKKSDLVELHGMLDKVCKRVLGLLNKYDQKNNPIEEYVDEFSSSLIRLGKQRDERFNDNGYYRAEDNYYRERYNFVLTDIAQILEQKVMDFNAFVFMYEPDPNDGIDD